MNCDAELDIKYMQAAIAQARIAEAAGEVPVGAVVVMDEKIIALAHNRTIGDCDPSAHAEIVALRDAANKVCNHRLAGAGLYVSLEPCVMCAGAILQARVARVVFGARDARFGAAGGALNLLESQCMNHKCEVVGGVLAGECGELLGGFFARRR